LHVAKKFWILSQTVVGQQVTAKETTGLLKNKHLLLLDVVYASVSQPQVCRLPHVSGKFLLVQKTFTMVPKVFFS
jgi:hypothetical protein